MKNQLTLGQLIAFLEKQDLTIILRHGFHDPHSYRGSYDELAFEPTENISIKEMLAVAKSAVDTIYVGWKGGLYKMTGDTLVNIAKEGCCHTDEQHDWLTQEKLELLLNQTNQGKTMSDDQLKYINTLQENVLQNIVDGLKSHLMNLRNLINFYEQEIKFVQTLIAMTNRKELKNADKT